MNYLAHLFLSGDSEEVLVGNFIGDYVKGKQYQNFPIEVQKGILLHRQIDTFTDNHELVKSCANNFREKYGRYSGIVTDVIFDHFLARFWSDYSSVSLRQFTKYVHAVLLSNYLHLPSRVKGFLPFLIQHKRLESYAHLSGIQKSLEIMGRRTSLPQESEFAVKALQENYSAIQVQFDVFFQELIRFVEVEFAVKIERNITPEPLFDMNEA